MKGRGNRDELQYVTVLIYIFLTFHETSSDTVNFKELYDLLYVYVILFVKSKREFF